MDLSLRPSARLWSRVLSYAVGGLVLSAPLAKASQDRLALVIGESSYAPAHPIADCVPSANTVAARLRAMGFDVIEQTDVANGTTDAALISFARQVAASPSPSAVVYFCGHAVDYDKRLFLLPVGAVVERPSDALTQGVPAQSVIDVAGSQARAALTVLDIFIDTDDQAQSAETKPSASPEGIQPPPDELVLVGSESGGAADSARATPLVNALSAHLDEGAVPLDSMAGEVRHDLAGKGLNVAIIGTAHMTLLPIETAAPAPPAIPRQAAPSAPAPPQTLAAKPPAASPASPPNAPTSSGNTGLDEVSGLLNQLSPQPHGTSGTPAQNNQGQAPAAAPNTRAPEADADSRRPVMERLRIQTVLQQSGYYEGPIDGIFGPKTRRAIRHFQEDQEDPVTGELTKQEAAALLSREHFATDQQSVANPDSDETAPAKQAPVTPSPPPQSNSP